MDVKTCLHRLERLLDQRWARVVRLRRGKHHRAAIACLAFVKQVQWFQTTENAAKICTILRKDMPTPAVVRAAFAQCSAYPSDADRAFLRRDREEAVDLFCLLKKELAL